MPDTPTNGILGSVRQFAYLQEVAGMTDGQLLEAYVTRRDEAAFEALVRQHGPMVLGVCRRVLGNPQDAEDAFQATFLVLVRKAASVRPQGRVAAWLHGVAYRAALKARALASRRRAREKQVQTMPEPSVAPERVWHDLEPLLDQELSRLPESYRLAVVLCDLEGKSRKEAARLLGWPEGTVAGRLTRARALLAKRLARHALPLSGAMLALLLSRNTASAGVPSSLMTSAVKTATGTVAPPVAAITEGVIKTMLLTKLKIGIALILAVAFLGVGAGVLRYPALVGGKATADEGARPRATGGRKERAPGVTLLVKNATLEGVDEDRRVVTLVVGPKGTTETPDAVRQAEVRIKQAKLKLAQARLRQKQAQLDRWALEVKRLQREVQRGIVDPAVLRESDNQLKAATADRDAAKADVEIAEAELAKAKALARRSSATRLENLPVAKNVEVTIPGKEARLSDLHPGVRASVRLATQGDRLVVTAIAVAE